jgi:hypothetical protein
MHIGKIDVIVSILSTHLLSRVLTQLYDLNANCIWAYGREGEREGGREREYV